MNDDDLMGRPVLKRRPATAYPRLAKHTAERDGGAGWGGLLVSLGSIVATLTFLVMLAATTWAVVTNQSFVVAMQFLVWSAGIGAMLAVFKIEEHLRP